MYKKTLLFFVILSFNFLATSQNIRINEVVSSNSKYSDEDGDTPDWLELRNYGTTPVSLSNWGLSNDIDNLHSWQFPDITLNPNEYLFLWASEKNRKEISYARTLVKQGDTYNYLIPNSEPDANWNKIGFNSSSWLSGASGFGYGDGDDATIVPDGTVSLYCRVPFTISDLSNLSSLILDIDYDDGFVAYINGVEVARANVNGTPPVFNATSFQEHEAQMYNGGNPSRFTINNAKNILVQGENILAIQVHNVNSSSSDLTLIPFLSALFNMPSNLGVNPPGILNLSDRDLHTNFKISATSETLILSDQNEKIIDQVLVEALNPDTSYGFSGTSNKYVYYTETTPGTANSNNEYLGVLGENIIFSHDGGLVNTSTLSLTLSGKTGSQQIRYTTDSTEPNETSNLYISPISINKNTVIRARLVQPNYISSLTQSKSYIFNANHKIDVVFLETEPDNFFDEDYGIYVFGNSYNQNVPYFGANFWQDWERPIHFSFYDKDSKQIEAEFDAGVKIYGGWSRANAQRSLSISLKGKYGTSEIEYPFFDSVNYDKFKGLVLRNSGNDWLNTNIRDAALTSLMKDSGLDFTAFNPVATYLNGEYWGMYNLREKINEDFLAEKHNLDPDDITILEFNPDITKVTNVEYNELINYVSSTDLTNNTNFEYVKNRVDLENFAVYELAEIYFNNTDWPHNNIKFWNHPGGKWKWILYDTDFGFGLWNLFDYNNNTLNYALRDGEWSTELLRNLVTNISFRNQFINRFADELNSRFLPQNVKDHLDSVFQMVQPEINAHFTRWGSNPSNATYNLGIMKTYAERRPSVVKENIKSQFGLAAYHQLTIANTNISQGFVLVNNNLKIQKSSWNGDYFEGVPVELKAIPEKGFEFSHWTGASNSTNATIQLNLKNASSVTPHFIVSTLKPIVINEINYKSNDIVNADDWIELYNPNTVAIDVSNWILKDNDDTHIFNLPANTTIGADGYLVLLRNEAAFKSVFPSITNYIGEFGFGLGSTDSIRLYNEYEILQDEVNYDSKSPWPKCADGDGPTLELISANLDNSLATSWNCSEDYGSPNAKNTSSISDEFVTIYPVPLYGSKNLTIEGMSINKVEIYSILGIRLFDKNFDNVTTAELNLINLKTGVYLVRINKDITKKLIVE